MANANTDPSLLGSYAGAVADLIATGETAYSYTGLPGSTTPSIDLTAAAPYAYTDCSGWVDYALSAVAPLHAAVLGAARQEQSFNRTVAFPGNQSFTVDEADQRWSRADVLATTFLQASVAGGDGFARVVGFGALQAGDIVAYATGVDALLSQPDPGSSELAKIPSDTGHVMIATGPAVEVPDAAWDDGTGQQPADIVKVWALPVVDSSDLHHFEEQAGFLPPEAEGRSFVLPDGAPDGAKPGGLGRGTIWFAQDAQGDITHFRFDEHDPWIPNTTGKAAENKALLIAAARPVTTIDLDSTSWLTAPCRCRPSRARSPPSAARTTAWRKP